MYKERMLSIARTNAMNTRVLGMFVMADMLDKQVASFEESTEEQCKVSYITGRFGEDDDSALPTLM